MQPLWLPMRYAPREFFIDNILVRIHFIIVMIRWTGLAPWEFLYAALPQVVPGSGVGEWEGASLRRRGFKNYFTEMCSGFEEGSYLRLIDFCITQL